MTNLAIGENHVLTVDPRPLFVFTNLEVAPGERYRFTASGQWKDWFHVVGPSGWKRWPLHLKNRLPGAPFFCLCGCVGSDDSLAFAIGEKLDWSVPESSAGLADRQLYFFANDWPCMYGNNHALPPEEGGPLSVNITRLA